MSKGNGKWANSFFEVPEKNKPANDKGKSLYF
jgi:hypothetical protein